MKSLILALGVAAIIAAFSSTIRVDAKAFFFFPSQFDYKKDKTNDGYVSTLFYRSPFTGKQYKYTSNWLMPPNSHQVAYNYDWSYGGTDANTQQAVKTDSDTTTTATAPKQQNPHAGAGKFHKQIGNVKIAADWSYNYKPAGSSAAATTAATPADDTTTMATTTDRDLDWNEAEE